ncbi:MAG: JDVT-CTERM domain-containing protein [Proteobacteria bacterium]|nr:JDVT-CTERM domain-containing protein [Pseudomonadota bacterium]
MNADPTAKTTYEIWCYDENMVVGGDCYDQLGGRPDNSAFDLDQTNVIFTPNATGGFDVSTSAAPPPPPPPPPVVDSGEILGDYGGCTVGVADGTLDPTLPLLVLISLFYLLMRRRAEA